MQLQSWRANCDIQMLIYDCHPKHPDCDEISKVSDYIVGYNTKGNETLSQEKKRIKELILRLSTTEEFEDDPNYARTVARKILNTYISNRVISKQECMVYLMKLDLTSCTESFETISLSGAYKLTKDNTITKAGNPLIHQYATRDQEWNDISMNDFIEAILAGRESSKKEIVPHYVGASCYPIYPPTADYAKTVLMIHKPWIGAPPKYASDDQILQDFEEFFSSDLCPISVQINFKRQKQRYEEKRLHHEAVAKDIETIDLNTFTNMNDYEQDGLDAVAIASSLPATNPDDNLEGFYLGKAPYDWSVKHEVLNPLRPDIPINDWLDTIIKEELASLQQGANSNVELPERLIVNVDGSLSTSRFNIEDCKKDQKNVVLYAMKHLQSYVECEDKSTFEPLRMTIQGCAGSGKSTMIKTLVTCFKSVFQDNASVVVCGPTGSAAFNAGGVTCHHAFTIPTQNLDDPCSLRITGDRLKSLLVRLKHMKVLIIDERSMIASETLAIIEDRCRKIKEGTEDEDKLWGNIPFIFLVGDDFQLPPVKNGAFYIQENVKKNALNIRGDELFLDLSKCVMELTSSKRQGESEQKLLDLLAKVRMEDESLFITKDDAEFLCSYSINDIRYFTEEQANAIRNDPGTLQLFAFNEAKDEANRKKLLQQHSETNPVAIMKPKGLQQGKPTRKPKHFTQKEVPECLKICIGAKVQIYWKNLHPPFGLYNGAMGVVKDIVFELGENPNDGDFAKYVLVDFPQYCGPAYDKKHPTWVPISTIERKCKFGCCSLTYFPLQLCFAKTIHTFQGASVGPVPPGYTPNAVQRIICDLGDKQFEGNNPGLTYTCISRPTTLGDLDDKTTSAIFFDGNNITPERIMNLHLTANGRLYKKIKMRKDWIQILKQNLVQTTDHIENEQRIISWYRNYINNLF